MNPNIIKAEEAPDRLKDANGEELNDANGEPLYSIYNWAVPRPGFMTRGEGTLIDCIRCEVTEERNGEYELEMEYPMSGQHFDKIQNRGIIMAKPNEPQDLQPFRIYRISRPINGVVTINARHLTYDLGGVPVGPFTATNAADAVDGLMANAAVPSPFTVTTDITSSADFVADVPYSVRGWFGGREGSLLDVYGGEWSYSYMNCHLMKERGQDRGVVIKYGINMVDFNQEENLSNVWTGVLPYWKDQTTGQVVVGHILHADGDFDYERIEPVDVSADFQAPPTMEELTARGRQFIKENNVGVPEVDITVSWVPGMENCDLCDTVTVSFEQIGIKAKAKVVKAIYDTLKERYSELTIGNVKQTVADNIAYLNKKVGYGKS